MMKFLKAFSLPISVGFALHILLGFLGQYMFHYVSSDISLDPNSNSGFLFYFSDWYNFLYFVIPGFVAGYISKSHPALVGFFSILLATLFVSVFFPTTWYTYPGILPLVKYFVSSLPISCFGLVSAIAGFSVRRNRSNYAIKGTSV